MSNDEIENKQRLYQEYGRFITNFEQICETIRANIGMVMVFDSSKEYWEQAPPERWKAVDVLLEGLTAKPLMDKYYSLYILFRREDTEMLELLRKIKKLFVDKLVPIRNSLSHGVTSHGYRGWGEKEMDFSLFTLSHPKLGSDGFIPNQQLLSIESLSELNLNVEKLLACMSLFYRLEGIKTAGIAKMAKEAIKELLPQIKFSLELLQKDAEYPDENLDG